MHFSNDQDEILCYVETIQVNPDANFIVKFKGNICSLQQNLVLACCEYTDSTCI